MNFYRRFIGDIQAKTGGLTMAEFGAYDRLLDHYFSTEKPIDFSEVFRITRAMDLAEKRAVSKVLERFWERSENGWVQRKAEQEIARAQPLIAAARENGKKGGRPPKNKTQQEPSKKPSGFQETNPAETHVVKPLQKPEPDTASLRSAEGGSATLPGVPDQLFHDYMEVRRAKRAGKFTQTAAAGLVREAGKAGITVERAVQACCEFGWIGFNPEWYAQRVGGGANGHGKAANGYVSDRAARMAEAVPNLARGRPAQGDFIEGEVCDVTARRLG